MESKTPSTATVVLATEHSTNDAAEPETEPSPMNTVATRESELELDETSKHPPSTKSEDEAIEGLFQDIFTNKLDEGFESVIEKTIAGIVKGYWGTPLEGSSPSEPIDGGNVSEDVVDPQLSDEKDVPSLQGVSEELVPPSYSQVREKTVPPSYSQVSEKEVTPSSPQVSEKEVTPSNSQVSEKTVLPSSTQISEELVPPSYSQVSEKSIPPSSQLESQKTVPPSSSHVSKKTVLPPSRHTSEKTVSPSSRHVTQKTITPSSRHVGENVVPHLPPILSEDEVTQSPRHASTKTVTPSPTNVIYNKTMHPSSSHGIYNKMIRPSPTSGIYNRMISSSTTTSENSIYDLFINKLNDDHDSVIEKVIAGIVQNWSKASETNSPINQPTETESNATTPSPQQITYKSFPQLSSSDPALINQKAQSYYDETDDETSECQYDHSDTTVPSTHTLLTSIKDQLILTNQHMRGIFEEIVYFRNQASLMGVVCGIIIAYSCYYQYQGFKERKAAREQSLFRTLIGYWL